MPPGVPHRRLPLLVIVGVVLFAFWRPLFAGATLAPVDQVWGVEPFAAEAPTSLTIEPAPPDAAALHASWSARADGWRDGEFAFWDHGTAGGVPVFRDGVPFTHLLYVAVPAWFAPGLIAAVAMAIATFGARDLAARRGASEIAALYAGLAYGGSGLMFVWFGWPHATALALVPWVWSAGLAAARSDGARISIAKLGVALGALLWCGVFALALLALLGALVLAASEGDRRGWTRFASGTALGVMLAAPHLAASWAHTSWADAASGAAADSSADWATVLTVPFGSIFGNESAALPWFTGGTFQASIGFVGVATTALAVLGLGRGLARREAAGFALPFVAMAGIAIAWVGGPFEAALDLAAGSDALATHARVLVSLPLALAAADGLALLVDDHRPRRQVRVAARAALPLVVLLLAAGGAAVWRWADVVGAEGARRTAVAVASPSILVLVVGAAVAVAWWRGAADGRTIGFAACGFVLFELLTFGMAIPTAADRDERLAATAAHAEVAALIGSEGRLAGVGDVMVPAVAEALDLPDVRARTERSAGLAALFDAADADSLRAGAGGTVQQPRPRSDDAYGSGVWSALGVDAWVAPARSRPPGTRTGPEPAPRQIDAVLQPVSGVIDVPPGGLRAVELDLSTSAPVTVDVEVTLDGDVRRNRLAVPPSDATTLVVPIAGEDLPEGAAAAVVVRVDGEPSVASIGVHDGVTIRPGVIAGDDRAQLVMVDPVLLLHRPTPPARFASELTVAPAAATAAALVDGWDGIAAKGVVDRSIPADPQARAEVWAARSTDRLDAIVAATGPGVVVFEVPAAPGWSAEVDGRRVDHVVADAAFIGVPVDADSTRIELRYRPPHLVWSSLVAFLGLGFLLALARPGVGSRA